MTRKSRIHLLLLGVFAGASFVPAYAQAQDAQTAQLQRQIDSLQQQLQTLQKQVTDAKKSAQQASQAAQAAQSAVPAAAQGAYGQASGAPMFTKAKPAFLDMIHVSMSGTFVALEGAWRERSEVSNGASDPPFGSPGIPLQNSALWNENEFRMSAQQSRIALRAYGDMTPTQHLQAYYEMDFLGASTDANNRESNSFTPRIRQVWGSYDNDDYHFHFLGGQGWSMLTQNRVGITPRYENVPLTIDAQYVVGFNWLRNPQLRFVGDWNNIAWFGVSIEQPGAVFPGAPSAATVAPPAPTVVSINNTCTGSSHLNGTTTCSNDVAPDIIEKVALDPGWGHYEALALQRWFSDEVNNGTLNSWSQQVTFGWGVGGSFLVPAVPKFIDLQGSILYGQGIGRYSSSQLPDAVIGPNGSLSPITGLDFLVGAVAHPWTGLDVYAYYGQDQEYANSWSLGATQGGWGNPNFVNSGCLNQNLAGGTLGTFNTPIIAGTCTFDVQRTQEFTAGFWQTVYKGDLGRAVAGAEYEYVRLTAFPGLSTGAGTPNQGLHPDNNIFMFSFRYYPFD